MALRLLSEPVRAVPSALITTAGGVAAIEVRPDSAKTLEQFYGSTEEQLERALTASGY